MLAVRTYDEGLEEWTTVAVDLDYTGATAVRAKDDVFTGYDSEEEPVYERLWEVHLADIPFPLLVRTETLASLEVELPKELLETKDDTESSSES